MKTILLVLGLICLVGSGFGQTKYDYRTISRPFYIDDWINQNVPLGKVINYTDTTATLNDFKDKLIILDFWFTQCGDCIAEFPIEDSLQMAFTKDIQFIPVTFNSAKTVEDFLVKWEAKTGVHLSMPMIVGDTLLKKAFRHYYHPFYAWILPDGQIVGQTSTQFLTKENIEGLLKEVAKRKAVFTQLKEEAKKHPITHKNKNN